MGSFVVRGMGPRFGVSALVVSAMVLLIACGGGREPSATDGPAPLVPRRPPAIAVSANGQQLPVVFGGTDWCVENACSHDDAEFPTFAEFAPVKRGDDIVLQPASPAAKMRVSAWDAGLAPVPVAIQPVPDGTAWVWSAALPTGRYTLLITGSWPGGTSAVCVAVEFVDPAQAADVAMGFGTPQAVAEGPAEGKAAVDAEASPDPASQDPVEPPHAAARPRPVSFAPGELVDVMPAVLFAALDGSGVRGWQFPENADRHFVVAPAGNFILWATLLGDGSREVRVFHTATGEDRLLVPEGNFQGSRVKTIAPDSSGFVWNGEVEAVYDEFGELVATLPRGGLATGPRDVAWSVPDTSGQSWLAWSVTGADTAQVFIAPIGDLSDPTPVLSLDPPAPDFPFPPDWAGVGPGGQSIGGFDGRLSPARGSHHGRRLGRGRRADPGQSPMDRGRPDQRRHGGSHHALLQSGWGARARGRGVCVRRTSDAPATRRRPQRGNAWRRRVCD